MIWRLWNMWGFPFATQGDPYKSLWSSCQGGAKMSIRQKAKLRGLLPIFLSQPLTRPLLKLSAAGGFFPGPSRLRPSIWFCQLSFSFWPPLLPPATTWLSSTGLIPCNDIFYYSSCSMALVCSLLMAMQIITLEFSIFQRGCMICCQLRQELFSLHITLHLFHIFLVFTRTNTTVSKSINHHQCYNAPRAKSAAIPKNECKMRHSNFHMSEHTHVPRRPCLVERCCEQRE